MKSCAVIPAYNEEKTIAEVVLKAKEHVDFVIVVDDGSKDKTAEIAKKAGAVVVRHGRNLGKGKALSTGIERARELGVDAVVFLDADLQHDPSEIPKFLEALSDSDAVFGYRPGIGHIFRSLAGKFGSLVFSILFGYWRIRDLYCGYRAFKLSKIPEIEEKGYCIEVELAAKAIKNKLSIKQIPIKVIYTKHAVRKGISWFQAFLAFLCIFKWWFKLNLK